MNNLKTGTTLVVGASGATGRLLVNRLLESGKTTVKIIVRSTLNLPDNWKNNTQLTIVHSNIAAMSVEETSEIIKDCDSIASCLGHRVTWKGIFGNPKMLVTEAVELLCNAIVKNNPDKPIKFVLMNTAGNSNRDLNEHRSGGEKFFGGVLRSLLPPQADNEAAADYLRELIGQNNKHIEWVAVRPDTLTNEENVSEYSLHKSPTRSAIFNPGKTSRINVADFMAKLIVNDDLWQEWKGQMPVIYNINKQNPKK